MGGREAFTANRHEYKHSNDLALNSKVKLIEKLQEEVRVLAKDAKDWNLLKALDLCKKLIEKRLGVGMLLLIFSESTLRLRIHSKTFWCTISNFKDTSIVLFLLTCKLLASHALNIFIHSEGILPVIWQEKHFRNEWWAKAYSFISLYSTALRMDASQPLSDPRVTIDERWTEEEAAALDILLKFFRIPHYW